MKVWNEKWALAALALSMFLSSLGISIANVALPTLATEFAASFSAVQWVILIYLLANTILIVSVGRLGDLWGRKKVLSFGIGLFTVASLFCGLAPSLGALIAARVIQGFGAAILMAMTVAFVSETVSKEKTGSAMGLLGTMSAIGTAAGPSLGGVLISGPGWRAIFLILVPIGLLNFYLAHRYLPMTIREPQKNQRTLWSQLAALRNSALGANLLMNTLVATVVMSTLVVGPFYLSRALGLDATEVGVIMSISPLISILSGVPAGRIVDRWGAPWVVLVGLVEMAIGAVSMSLLPSLFGLAGYIVSAAIISPGYQMFQAANNTLVMTDVSADQRGSVSGMLSLSRNLGLITGTSVMGSVFAMASQATDIATGMSVTFFVAAVLIIMALLIAIRGPAS